MPHTATCHCGATRIKVDRLPEQATACTCTFCAKRGALWGYYQPGELRVVAEGPATIYARSSGVEHHSCAICGCTTYTLAPDWAALPEGADPAEAPKKPQLNLRLLDDVDVAELPVVTVDGRNLW